MDEQTMSVVVLVKAAPVMTSRLEETMCVAGARIDADAPAWVRLHPVPFRDLDDASKFTKYQTVSIAVRRDATDRRPESWNPVRGSIVPGDSISTASGWARRRHLVESLGEATMCDLVEINRSGSGPNTPSLAVVRPSEPPKLKISLRSEEQVREWQRRANGCGIPTEPVRRPQQPKAGLRGRPMAIPIRVLVLSPDVQESHPDDRGLGGPGPLATCTPP